MSLEQGLFEVKHLKSISVQGVTQQESAIFRLDIKSIFLPKCLDREKNG